MRDRECARAAAARVVANFGVGGVAPWASSLLAQLGATVVKIEAPNEFIMYTLPPWRGLTTTYAALNANVHSVKLNLKMTAITG